VTSNKTGFSNNRILYKNPFYQKKPVTSFLNHLKPLAGKAGDYEHQIGYLEIPPCPRGDRIQHTDMKNFPVVREQMILVPCSYTIPVKSPGRYFPCHIREIVG